MGNRSKLIAVLPIVVALATSGRAYGQTTDSQKIDENKFRKTVDFMFDASYLNKINRHNVTNLKEEISGGNVTTVYALNAVEGLKEAIAYLNSKEGRDFYNSKGENDQRLLLIGRFRGFISELSKAAAPSKKSLEALSIAVSNEIIEPEELGNVEDGFYVIEKHGKEKNGKGYRVFYLANIISETTPTQHKTIEKAYHDLVEKKINNLEQKTQTPELSLPLPEVPKVQEAPKKENPTQTETQKAQETPKEEIGFSIITEATSNFGFNKFGFNTGLRIAPFKNKNIGLAALVGSSWGLDRKIDSYNSPLSTGRTAYGTITNTNIGSVEFSGEFSYGPLFIDAGVNFQGWINNTVEKILNSSGNTVKSNTLSAPERQVAFAGAAGVEIPLGNFRPRLKIGYNGNPYLGVGCTFKLR